MDKKKFNSIFTREMVFNENSNTNLAQGFWRRIFMLFSILSRHCSFLILARFLPEFSEVEYRKEVENINK